MNSEQKRVCNGCGNVVRCAIVDGTYKFYAVVKDENKKDVKLFTRSCPQCKAVLSINTTEPSSIP